MYIGMLWQVGQLQTHDAASSGILNIDYSYIPGVRLDGGMHCALMTRSRICSVPRSEGCELLAVAADEMTRTVSIVLLLNLTLLLM